ncbi:glutathione S-transferase E2 [Culex quinquefasciatus]|uniref:glutathione transferase n=1 Tax=Culex quinquefasciatus TaxID=7176 RepID=B0XGJ9_CULQU|nr:glutathione S-transferase E2 [Culex quinquefasciatus]|eukprot:XP_001868771.1 glutathione S-transferase E2 [Culex quinquefasciatus]
MHMSPPRRAVELTANALGLHLDLRVINLMAGDHLKPEYLKLYVPHTSYAANSVYDVRKTYWYIGIGHIIYKTMDPRHTIPLLDDNGTIIPESHAIMIYLASKYGKDDSLYPKDLAKQSKVNAALFFELGVLFARMSSITYPIFLEGCREIPPVKAEGVRKAYQLLEDTLVDDYVAESSLTIGEFSCISSVSSVMGFIPIDRAKFPRIHG